MSRHTLMTCDSPGCDYEFSTRTPTSQEEDPHPGTKVCQDCSKDLCYHHRLQVADARYELEDPFLCAACLAARIYRSFRIPGCPYQGAPPLVGQLLDELSRLDWVSETDSLAEDTAEAVTAPEDSKVDEGLPY